MGDLKRHYRRGWIKQKENTMWKIQSAEEVESLWGRVFFNMYVLNKPILKCKLRWRPCYGK